MFACISFCLLQKGANKPKSLVSPKKALCFDTRLHTQVTTMADNNNDEELTLDDDAEWENYREQRMAEMKNL